jgi:GDP-4-dehydro-6-deoxy-D-mannose reductase
MRTVFITGADGFTGRHLLNHLVGRGFEVVAGVRNRARKLGYERQGHKALVCDVTDAINVARVIASVRPDGVIHLAGLPGAAIVAGEPLEAFQTVVSSWANILDAVRRAVPRAKVVLAGSGEVYGNAGVGNGPVSETASPQPVDTFGSWKLAAETIASTFFRDYHLNVTIARPFHYLGAGQSPRSFWVDVAQRLANFGGKTAGGELHFPDLACRRDVLHIQDVLTAYERLLQDGRPNEIYNICSGNALTCREIVGLMVQEFGLTLDLEQQHEADGSSPLPVLWGSHAKLKTELGWQPTHSVQDAVRDLVQSLRKAPQPTGR